MSKPHLYISKDEAFLLMFGLDAIITDVEELLAGDELNAEATRLLTNEVRVCKDIQAKMRKNFTHHYEADEILTMGNAIAYLRGAEWYGNTNVHVNNLARKYTAVTGRECKLSDYVDGDENEFLK